MNAPTPIIHDDAARFDALTSMSFDDLTMGDLRELHGMCSAKDAMHVNSHAMRLHRLEVVQEAAEMASEIGQHSLARQISRIGI